jgi:hypothetical protein
MKRLLELVVDNEMTGVAKEITVFLIVELLVFVALLFILFELFEFIMSESFVDTVNVWSVIELLLVIFMNEQTLILNFEIYN